MQDTDGPSDALTALHEHLGGAERPLRALLEPRNDGVLLGPAGAGKTSLLASLARACEAVTVDLELDLVPGGALARLIGGLARGLAGETPLPSTAEAATYDLQLKLEGQAFAPLPAGERQFEITVQDTPGLAVFDAVRDWGAAPGGVAQILDEACSANWLVLCVDATNPQPCLWQAAVPQLVARLASKTNRLIRRGSANRTNRAGDYPEFVAQERKLPQQRVLVLLTKIDRVCTEALRLLEGSPTVRQDRRLRELSHLGGEGLARRLDPLRMVDDALGGGALRALQAALPQGGQIAVGMSSALGFPPAAADDVARVRRLPEPTGPLLSWRPFGLREALTFLATGQCLYPITAVQTVSGLTSPSGQVLFLTSDGAITSGPRRNGIGRR